MAAALHAAGEKSSSAVALTVTQSAQRLIDLPVQFGPLAKELACRAVCAHPDREGQHWHIRSGVEPCPIHGGVLRLTAVADCDGRELATLSVPPSRFTSLAERMAAELGWKGTFSFRLTVPPPEDPGVSATGPEADHAADFTLEDAGSGLTLPIGFSRERLNGRAVLRAADSFVRCVFRRDVFKELIVLAWSEKHVERGFLAPASIHLTDDACCVLIEGLVELKTVEASSARMRTTGQDFLKAYQGLSGPVGGYVHFHPPSEKDEDLGPQPSTADVVTFWDVDRVSPLPMVYPIVTFGAGRIDLGSRVRVFGYECGVLREIALEVLT